MTQPSDIEIASSTPMRPIADVAEDLGIPTEQLVPYGHYKAKVSLPWLRGLEREQGRLVLVTATSPTPAGEGKTTTVVGLGDALNRLGRKTVVCLREPSMGPVFGMKGGAAGGGYAQVNPMTDINLHFTGDFAAIAAANNLLAAMLDNHLHQGNSLGIDARRITWKRVLDTNDRALREIVVGLGGPTGGVPHEGSFDIVVASEVMAIFCLATSIADLKERLGRVVVARTRDNEPITAADLKAHGAMTALLVDALSPNLVQTLEGNPAFVHGGPFANIAHGCNSVAATEGALRLGDVVVTEAGFGADLGAEKFIDLKCRMTGLRPDAAVVVATVRSMKYHGGVAVQDLQTEDVDAVQRGLANLRRHVDNLTQVFNVPVVVSLNRFATDTDVEVEAIVMAMADRGISCTVATHFTEGGAGCEATAREVLRLLETSDPSKVTFAYEDDLGLIEKVEAVAKRTYGAEVVEVPAAVRRQVRMLEDQGHGRLPVCIAKTQVSFATDKTLRGAPTGHAVQVREVRLAAGAGFVVFVCGELMTMPGLPKVPGAERIDVDEQGRITGLF